MFIHSSSDSKIIPPYIGYNNRVCIVYMVIDQAKRSLLNDSIMYITQVCLLQTCRRPSYCEQKRNQSIIIYLCEFIRLLSQSNR